jgi:NAD(P)-dependent dehydrogenase (short-subunit alcohol dehydrogenase family)
MCSQAVACRLRDARLPGRIVHIGSIHSHTTVPQLTPYAASKGGIDGMTRQMALALAPHKISVNCIAPGLIEVQRIRNDPLYEREDRARQIPWGRVGDPADVARVCVFFASDASDFITGQVLYVDGGQGAKLAMKRGVQE